MMTQKKKPITATVTAAEGLYTPFKGQICYYEERVGERAEARRRRRQKMIDQIQQQIDAVPVRRVHEPVELLAVQNDLRWAHDVAQVRAGERTGLLRCTRERAN